MRNLRKFLLLLVLCSLAFSPLFSDDVVDMSDQQILQELTKLLDERKQILDERDLILTEREQSLNLRETRLNEREIVLNERSLYQSEREKLLQENWTSYKNFKKDQDKILRTEFWKGFGIGGLTGFTLGGATGFTLGVKIPY